MSGDSATLKATLADQVHLSGTLENLRASYASAKPFPHLVLDNLFPAELLEAVRLESSRMAQGNWLNVEQESLERIVRMRSAMEVGAAGGRLVSLLHSAAFLYLLSEITGIWQLLPDPYLQGGGHALMHPGGYFKVHADRNVAYETGLTRRLALIIFLNKDWSPEYRGQLELWDATGTRREASFEPEFNKTVLFEVAYPNYHGVPEPLACPPGRMRQSFIVYYHTVGTGNAVDSVNPHSSIFAPHFYRRKKSALRLFGEQLMPPIVLRAMGSLIRRIRK